MKNISLYKNIIAIAIIAVFCGGAIVYADFVRTSGSKFGFSYGYGYGYDQGYGYGYGYHSLNSLTNKEIYGFLGSDGSTTIDSISSGQTSLAVTYTTTYTATNTVEYGSSYLLSTTPVLESADSYTVTLTGLTCGTTYNIRVSSEDIGGNTWNDNATTATTSACSSGGGGGGGSVNVGSISSSGSGSSVGDGSGCSSGDIFSRTTGQRCPSSVGGVNGFVFSRDLEFGMTNEDVRELQQYLNANGFPVASSGAGSPGFESDYFGPATRAALAKFQAANGINPPAGYFGSITRAFVNGQSTQSQTPSTSTFTFSRDLEFGMTNGDVMELQKYLNRNGFPVSASGAGSLGNESNYFGPATRAALAKFQAANNINPPAGYFGSITRAFVNRQ